MLEFDTICGEGKNYTESINMKTLMNTAMTTIMKSSLCALAALLLAAPSLAETYVWNTNIASGNMSEAGSWLVDGTAAEAAPGANDHLVIDSAGATCLSTLDNALVCRSLLLSNKATVYGVQSIAADKLVAGIGYSKLRCGSAVFGGFESKGFLGTIGVRSGSVRFTDSSGLRQIGGVLPEFAIIQDNNQTAGNPLFYTPYGICRLDADGYVVEYPTSEMHQGLLDAGENDTVLVSADTTLVSDLTVNAICVSSDRTIDLNGHTLTVKSGVIRGSARWSASTIENGTLVSPEPIMYVDGVNNSNVRWSCNIVVVGNADIEKPVLAAISCGAFPELAGNTDLVGRVLAPKGSFGSSYDSSTIFWDLAKGVNLASIGDNNSSCTIRGMAGAGEVKPYGQNAKFWLGTRTDGDVWNGNEFVVGSNGILRAGSLVYDGSRAGDIAFADQNSNIKAYQKLIFKAGGTLGVTVRGDGTATKVTTSGTSNYRTKVTIEGGNLEVVEAGKVKQGTWTVMRTVDPITGTFDSVTSGYKAKYNVEVVEDGVTYYELQLTKNTSGTIIIIR